MSEVILHTDGNGLWSNEKRPVRITDIQLEIGTDWGDGELFGELRVYFDTDTWDTRKHGLIYTDRAFERELRALLDKHGLPGKDVCYSEQGMQGDDYVSLDAGTQFYTAWIKKFNLKREEMVDMF